jgi:hypothetical protein
MGVAICNRRFKAVKNRFTQEKADPSRNRLSM